MIISCKCLNISLELGKTRPKGMPLSSLQLTSIEESHQFFTEGVAEIEKVINISKRVATLSAATIVDNWIIETCLNCAQPYYAKHKENKHLPLISAGLIADPNTITLIKNHPDFSPAFQILIKHVRERTKLVEEASVETVLNGLQQSLDTAIKTQVEKTDENIRQYSEQQFEFLTKFQTRAVQDHALLVKNIQASIPDKSSIQFSDMQNKSKPSVTSYSSDLSSPERLSSDKLSQSITKQIPIIRPSAKRSNSLFSSMMEHGASCDAEGVFNLEDMDDFPSENVASGDSDTDHDDSGSHDEGIDIHRKKEGLNLARSLPVNVPAFAPGGLKLHAVDIPHDLVDTEDPKDIAASIKALARSVHGDVFGDLPRPRFSTQI